LVSAVLGAVLALVGGMATELWKQRKAARAAARLVWLELILARSALLGAVALSQWPDGGFPFADDVWTAQRDRLALAWTTRHFHDVQTAYLQLRAIADTPSAERGDPVLFRPALMLVERAAETVGRAAHVDKKELEQFRRPLSERLDETRMLVEQLRAAGPEQLSDLLDQAASDRAWPGSCSTARSWWWSYCASASAAPSPA
jgi:hypothetical protein